MKSMFSLSAAVAAMLAGSCVAKHPVMDSRLIGRQANYKYEGCYSTAGSLNFNATATWQSKDTCFKVCSPMDMAVEATTNANACWCGNALPPQSALVDDSKCDMTCSGYPYENCKFTHVWFANFPLINQQVVARTLFPSISQE
jgi:hypothetical protein